jgi:hypothetical protein
MEINNKILEFWGNCEIKTNLNLEELALKVSKSLCGGLPFIYGENSIWEEIPSMYIDHSILGMFFIIGGYGGDLGYQVAIKPTTSSYVYKNNLRNKEVRIRLDFHLYHLLKEGLKNYSEIKVINPNES